MKIRVYRDVSGHKIYRRHLLSENAEFGLYCFLCGFVTAVIIVVALLF